MRSVGASAVIRAAVLAAVVAAAALTAGACASAPIKPDVQAQLRRADALVQQGCYDCLIEARDIYERAAVGKARPLVIVRLFESSVLVAMRERELVLDATAAFARAKALIPELPAGYPGDDYYRLAESVPSDPDGTPHTETLAFRQTHDSAWVRRAFASLVPSSAPPATSAPVAAAASPAFREYLRIAVDCGWGIHRLDARPPLADGAPPLVRYRQAICAPYDGDALDGVVAEVPRFVEADFYIGMRAAYAKQPGEVVSSSADTAKARTAFTAVDARFPASPLVALEAGKLEQRMGDCTAALAHYAKTIAAKPRHEDALLQRAICLSYLKRHDDAIATATQLIDWNTDNAPEAHYWRAWNERELGRLPDARRDSDEAKARLFKESVMLLAGMIEYDQDDLVIAEKDFHATLQANPNQCSAIWYLGLVQIKREAWIKSGDEFVQARACYVVAELEDRAEMDKMRKADVDETFKAQQLANFQVAIDTDHSQQSAASYDAALQYLRGGDKDKAIVNLDLAAQDPARADAVAKLRALIKAPRSPRRSLQRQR